MTKANDLASLLDANGDVVSSALDNVPPSNDASALTTGTLAAARLPADIVVSDASPELSADLATNSNDINFGTNAKSNYGTSAQLMMYHDGSNGWIKGNNAGNNSIAIQSGGTGSVMISGSSGQNIITQQGDSAHLHYAGVTKLNTSADGVQVAGAAQAQNFHDNQTTTNVNLGNGVTEGRGVVAGYSGGAYSGLGYNIRHTSTTNVLTIPNSDTASYLQFRNSGFDFFGAPSGTAGRSATLGSGFNKLMQITSTGDVALGSVTPQSGGGAAQWLTIGGTTYSGGTIFTSSNVVKNYHYYDSSGDVYHQAMNGVGQKFVTDGNYANPSITITAAGNVGIKNPNPSTPLDVTTAGGANWVAQFQNSSAGNSYGVSISEPSGATAGYPLLRVGQGFSPYADYLRVNTNGNSGFGGNPSTLARVNIVTTSRDKAGLRMKRSIYNWFQYGLTPSNGAYIHIKTGLKMGGAGNVHPTMSMFDIKGYNYSAEIIDSKIGFHNWSGGAYSLIMQNYGNRAAAVAPYASTDDYVVLVVNCGTNYPGFTIDWHQAFEYGFVDVGVLNYTDSSSTSGVY